MLEALRLADGEMLIRFQHLFVHPGWTPVVTFITRLGNGGMIWIALILLMLCFRKTRKAGCIAAITLAVSFGINNLLLKNLVARTRPYEVFEGVQRLIGKPSDYSFPSGHSAASFVTAVVMFRELPHRYGVPALVLAFLIALSRLYVGVHYPLDVIAGALSGTVIALLTVWAAERWIRSRKERLDGTYRK